MNLRGNPRSSTLVCRAQNMLEFREGPDQKQKGWGFDEETDDYKEFYPGSIHELSPPEALSPSLLPVNSLPILILLAHSRLCILGLSLWDRTLKCFRLPFTPVSSHYSQLSSFALFSLPVSEIIFSLARLGRKFLSGESQYISFTAGLQGAEEDLGREDEGGRQG